MSGVAIVTDSNSGITQEEAKRLGIFVLPMPFYIDGELFYEDISLTQEKFYERLTQDADNPLDIGICTTSSYSSSAFSHISSTSPGEGCEVEMSAS